MGKTYKVWTETMNKDIIEMNYVELKNELRK